MSVHFPEGAAQPRVHGQTASLDAIVSTTRPDEIVGLAHQAGHLCDHVNFIGLSGLKDWQLMDTIRTGEYAFVTENAADFIALYRHEQLHSGLVIIIPNVTPARQRDLFKPFSRRLRVDLINAVVEVDFSAGTITCREYVYPES